MVPTAPPPFASAYASYDPEKDRFAVPDEILESAGWIGLTNEERRLVAECIGDGHLRLHRQSAIDAHLSELRHRVQSSSLGSSEKEDVLQVLQDKYREVAFYRSDKNRVMLKEEELTLFTHPTFVRPKRVFLQARTDSIDVMTDEARVSRAKSPIRLPS